MPKTKNKKQKTKNKKQKTKNGSKNRTYAWYVCTIERMTHEVETRSTWPWIRVDLIRTMPVAAVAVSAMNRLQ
jgi:hypothetical protein